MTNIEQLKKETNEIKKNLEELKNNVSLSEVEKKNKVESLKNQVEATKQKIENEIHSLENKTDDESKKKKEEAETLLNTFNETMSLYSSILNNWNTRTEVVSTATTSENPAEEKWFFWKTWEWVWEQWEDVWDKEKWKTETWTNLLRTTWFIATWVWAAALAYKWVKKLWNWAFWDDEDNSEEDEQTETKSKKKKKKKEKSGDDTPFWDTWYWKALKRTGIWTAAYYVSHWIYTKNRWLNDLFDWEKGKKLEFDAALEYSKWAIANQDNKEGMSYGMDLKYHEDSWEIEAYWERIKIDKDKRKIVWVWLWDVEFKKYEHMINAAILIAYLKKNYSWKCVNNNPFHLTWDWQWDINVNTSEGDKEGADWTGNAWRIVGVTAGWIAWIVTWIFGGLKPWVAVTSIWCVWWYMLGSAYDHNNIMNDHMPELDNEHGKKSLQAYLNSMDCRKSRNQGKEDITESPIKDKVRECIDDIQRENPELPSRWWRRQFDMIQDPNDKDKYTIKVYWREIVAEVKWTTWNEKIKILWISWWNPVIKTDMSKWNISGLELPLKEWIYMTCLLWFLLDTFHHKWNEYPRFKYDWKAVKLITTGFWL